MAGGDQERSAQPRRRGVVVPSVRTLQKIENALVKAGLKRRRGTNGETIRF